MFRSARAIITHVQGLAVRTASIDRVTASLASVAEKNSSLQEFVVVEDQPYSFAAAEIHNALIRTEAVKNSDMIVRHTKVESESKITFRRQCWWKDLLQRNDIPLNLWPCILKDADNWSRESSHSHLDILNFLVREKNILLQNVRCRRCRKRRRYGLDA